ncbi:citrate lyase ligase [Coriobacterium glomerans PW2]|uniref:[Citrate [pro-3S]-lyase] ligase n=1 Tax=Coriobacterium glomerans (strain ATCC 49209 / DSM 20642 / JCM 10262 / PW2) TaxID=700015 RepID=F2NBF2_CORGP|nr:[citrate (pro-3S)-lyase] ligase [Coriobacterium glomerans]AEB06688.1 citrate lyase ligase [Coriobacterium glomerans PW2]
MDDTLRVLNLDEAKTFAMWRAFLERFAITNFTSAELTRIDRSLGIFDVTGRLVATGSAAGDVLKYVAVDNESSEQGSRFNALMTALMDDRARKGIFHLFVSCGPHACPSFEHIGFHVLVRSDLGALLETGDRGIDDYVANLPRIPDQNEMRVAAIVMNANPFTCGHRALVERAVSESDLVYVFVVSDDVSLVPTADRIALVRQGVRDLPRVRVVAGGEYMVSRVTFPAYFLPSDAQALTYQTTLDALLFKCRIAPPLNITARYLGTEPFSPTTARYNEALKRELPPEVEVRIMERARSGAQVISATAVRAAIEAGAPERIADLVPDATFAYIKEHIRDLQARSQRR